MKKIIFSLTLLLMVLASCQYKGGAGSGSAVLSFDSLVIDSTVRLNPNSEQPNGHLALHLIYAKPQSNSDAAAKAPICSTTVCCGRAFCCPTLPRA